MRLEWTTCVDRNRISLTVVFNRLRLSHIRVSELCLICALLVTYFFKRCFVVDRFALLDPLYSLNRTFVL